MGSGAVGRKVNECGRLEPPCEYQDGYFGTLGRLSGMEMRGIRDQTLVFVLLFRERSEEQK